MALPSEKKALFSSPAPCYRITTTLAIRWAPSPCHSNQYPPGTKLAGIFGVVFKVFLLQQAGFIADEAVGGHLGGVEFHLQLHVFNDGVLASLILPSSTAWANDVAENRQSVKHKRGFFIA